MKMKLNGLFWIEILFINSILAEEFKIREIVNSFIREGLKKIWNFPDLIPDIFWILKGNLEEKSNTKSTDAQGILKPKSVID